VNLAGLEALALAAILRIAGDVEAEERARLQSIAFDVALAVELGRAPFVGPAAPEAAALALVAIAAHEAGPTFAEDVARCQRRGDLDISRTGSLSLWQLLGPFSRDGETPEAVCSNQALAAFLALRVLAIHGAHCPNAPWLSAFQGYAGGRCGHPYASAARQCASWEKLSQRAGIVASCSNRAPITWRLPHGE